ncbi:MAG: hypothetical protein BIFFINMI_00195 [Phycisphaerae bacterium]|nr:hypothetical protein [Phycisphaerae bacterium]
MSEPSPPPDDGRRMSAAERGLFILLLLVVAGLFGLWLTRFGGWREDRMDVSFQPPGHYADQAGVNRLDPNTASWQMLGLLPGLGEGKAKAIVAWREQWSSSHPGCGPAFTRAEDLAAVPGIGPRTVERLAPQLWFPTPTTAPTTAPREF